MALAWGVLFPAAATAARHLKPLGGPLFFYAHLGLIALAFIFLCAGFGVIHAHVAEDGPGVVHYSGSVHTQLGLAVFILAWFQPVGGLLRPAAPKEGDKPTRARRLWELGHQAAGRVLIGLALLTAATGIAMAKDHGAGAAGADAGLLLWLLWCILGLGGGSVALEVLRKRRDGVVTAGTGGWGRVGA